MLRIGYARAHAADLHRNHFLVLIELRTGRCREGRMLNGMEHDLIDIHARQNRQRARPYRANRRQDRRRHRIPAPIDNHRNRRQRRNHRHDPAQADHRQSHRQFPRSLRPKRPDHIHRVSHARQRDGHTQCQRKRQLRHPAIIYSARPQINTRFLLPPWGRPPGLPHPSGARTLIPILRAVRRCILVRSEIQLCTNCW